MISESEARQQLATANDTLTVIAEQLIANPRDMDHSLAALREISRALSGLQGQLPPAPISPAIRAALSGLGVQAQRVGKLLNAAAAFYCGSLCSAGPRPGSYDAAGELDPAASAGYLCIEG